MGDLGVSSKDLYGGDSIPSSTGESEDKKQYPSTSLRNGQVEAAGLGDCDVGDEYTATVRFRVTSKSASDRADGTPSKDLGIELVSLDDVQSGDESAENQDEAEPDAEAEEPAAEDTTSAEEKMLGFKRPSASKKVPFADTKKLTY